MIVLGTKHKRMQNDTGHSTKCLAVSPQITIDPYIRLAKANYLIACAMMLAISPSQYAAV